METMTFRCFLSTLIIFAAGILVYSGSSQASIQEAPRFSSRNIFSSAGRINAVINVDDFGAKADLKTDDSQAFRKAWSEACSTSQSILLVPANKFYYLKPVIFQGPCQPGNTMRIEGGLMASKNRADYAKNQKVWIKFSGLKNFTVEGGGILYGNGQVWWPFNCNVDRTRPCVSAPTALTFQGCNNLKVRHLAIRNGQQQHFSFHTCANVEVSNIRINTKPSSPNTDGIHITNSYNIQINNCDFKTGDDCIDIVAGSSDIRVMDFNCGQGAHGISLGSLGRNRSEEYVSNINVTRAIITGTLNGVRVKTWQGGRGFVKNITFQDIKMYNVTNPIIINQFYCGEYFENLQDCPIQKDGVLVENVLYKNITGTSALEKGVIFNCSATVPCEGIKLEGVQLKRAGYGGSVFASCNNVHIVQQEGTNTPQCPK